MEAYSQDKLLCICRAIKEFLDKDGDNILVKSSKLLEDVLEISGLTEKEIVPFKDCVSLYCCIDSKNECYGVCEIDNKQEPRFYYSLARSIRNGNPPSSVAKAKVLLEGVYTGLTSLFGLSNNPGPTVVVFIEDNDVVEMLNSPVEQSDDWAKDKIESITELKMALPSVIVFQWLHPKASTYMKQLKKELG